MQPCSCSSSRRMKAERSQTSPAHKSHGGIMPSATYQRHWLGHLKPGSRSNKVSLYSPAAASFIYFSNGSICHCRSRSLRARSSPPPYSPSHSQSERRGFGGGVSRQLVALSGPKLAFLTECRDTCTALIKGPSLRFTFDESSWFETQNGD